MANSTSSIAAATAMSAGSIQRSRPVVAETAMPRARIDDKMRYRGRARRGFGNPSRGAAQRQDRAPDGAGPGVAPAARPDDLREAEGYRQRGRAVRPVD